MIKPQKDSRIDNHSPADIFLLPQAKSLQDGIEKVKSCQPGKKNEKYQVGTNHLGFFRPRNNRAECHSQSRGRYVDA